MSTSANFGEDEVVVLEGHPVTIGRDVNVKRIILAFVQTAITKFKQFWVKRSAKQVKAQVGNFWSNR